MGLLKDIVLPNGSTGKYHKIVRIETAQELDSLRVQVASWASIEFYNSKAGAIWNSYINIPIGDLLTTTENLLLTTEPFIGAEKEINAAPLETAKFLKWVEIKAIRDKLEWEGFTWNGVIFDSNIRSQSLIQGAVILAMQDPQYQVAWTLKDNTIRILSSTDLLSIGVTLAAHIEYLRGIANTHRQQIDAAQNVAEVNAISW